MSGDADATNAEQILALFGRIRSLALLAGAEFAGPALRLQAALQARGRRVVAGIETACDGTAPVRAGRVDMVLIIGAAPADPSAWRPQTALGHAMAVVSKAVAERAPVRSILGGVTVEGEEGLSSVQVSGTVEWLAEKVAEMPEDDPVAFRARWSEAADAVRKGMGSDVRRCFSQYPELRCARDSEGRSLLHVAASAGSLPSAKAILEGGGAWELEDDQGLTAGDLALSAGSQEVFDLLVRCASSSELGMRTGDESRAELRAKRRRTAGHADYLQQRLRYEGGELLDADGKGVMMGWERGLMAKHAEALLPASGADVLNVGFGLGLVDGFLADRCPRSHHIIEAHPDVLAQVERLGWTERPGVRVWRGRWQDVIDDIPANSLDAVFWDTWQETYLELRAFMAHLPRLLRPGGRFSFFSGFAPYNIFYHAVYCRLAQEDLQELGLVCDFLPLEIGSLSDETWRGVASRYWQFETYYLPLARLGSVGVAPESTESNCGPVRAEPPWRRWPMVPVRVGDAIGRRDLIDDGTPTPSDDEL